MSDLIEGRVSVFIPVQAEMSDLEIRRDYGALIEDAVSAFEYDPSYLVDMAEHASLIAYKRALWEVRLAVQKKCRSKSGPKFDAEMTAALKARGITAPAKLSRGSRRKPKAA